VVEDTRNPCHCNEAIISAKLTPILRIEEVILLRRSMCATLLSIKFIYQRKNEATQACHIAVPSPKVRQTAFSHQYN